MKFLQKYEGWVRTICVLLAIGATQFLDIRFVAKAVYEKDKAVTDKSLVDMATAIALLQQNGKNLEDHEQRLRFLERNRSKANSNYENPDAGPFPDSNFRASN